MHRDNYTLTLTGLQPFSPRVFHVVLLIAAFPVPRTIATAATELALRIDSTFLASGGAKKRGGGGIVVHNDLCQNNSTRREEQ